jgi:hypothetical protein
MTARREREEVPEFLFALVRAGLAELDMALDSLERCYAARDSRVFWFNVAPIGGPLLQHPGFAELMRRVEETVRASSAVAASAAEDLAPH